MTLYRLADNLAIRVGRDSVWIWAPDVSEHPIRLDAGMLNEMGLRLTVQASEDPSSPRRAFNAPPWDPSRSA